jgi:hypothetical protein
MLAGHPTALLEILIEIISPVAQARPARPKLKTRPEKL